MTNIDSAGASREPYANLRIPVTRDPAGKITLDFERLLQPAAIPPAAQPGPIQPSLAQSSPAPRRPAAPYQFPIQARLPQTAGQPTSPALRPFEPLYDGLPVPTVDPRPAVASLLPVSPGDTPVAMVAARDAAQDLCAAATAITGSVGALTIAIIAPSDPHEAVARATPRNRTGGDVQALAISTPYGDVPVVVAGPAPAIALLYNLATAGTVPGLRTMPGAPCVIEPAGMGIIPGDPAIRPVPTVHQGAARTEAGRASTAIALAVQTLNQSNNPLTVQTLHPWAFPDAKAQETEIVETGGHAIAAIIPTAHGDVPVLFQGTKNDIARLYQQLVFGDHPGASPYAGREGSRYNDVVDVRPFTTYPLPTFEDVGKASRFMLNRFTGKVEADAVTMPELVPSAIVTGTGRPLPTAERFQPHPNTPILNTLNAVLATRPVRTMLDRAGIRIEIPEALVRFSQTTPRAQNKQAWELDPLWQVLTIGIENLAHFAVRGDRQGVKDSAAFIGNGLNSISDAVLRPGRSTFTEEAQSSFVTKLQEGLEPLGVPLITKSTFFELSVDRNLTKDGGTGFLTYDRARDSFIPRIERNPDTGKIVLMRDAIVKSFWQGQVAFALPQEHDNPLVGRIPHPLIDGAIATVATAAAMVVGPGAYPVAAAAAPAVKLASDLVLSGGLYGLAEGRMIDYGPNKGYLTLPAGTEISERVLSLIMEAIIDPAAFSKSGRDPDDVTLLARTFDTMAIHPIFDLKNRGDNVLELVKANRDNGPTLARGIRIDGDVKAEVIWNPLARRETPLPDGVSLPLIGENMPLTWLNGFNPFGILQSLSIGLVVKANIFPATPDTYRTATLNPAGDVIDQHIHDRNKDSLAKNFTQLNIQATGSGAPDGLVGLRLQNAVARAITGNGTRPGAPLQTWAKYAAASVQTMLADLEQSGDPAVIQAVNRATFAFHHAPATGLVTAAQRQALTDVMLAEANRLAQNGATAT